MSKIWTAIICTIIYVFSLAVAPVGAERINDPLVANDFIKETPKNTTLNFTIRDFTESVNPPAGGSLSAITFRQLTAKESGTLRLGTELVTLDTGIPTEDLDKLNFVPAKDYEGEAIFTWDAHYGTLTSPYPSAVTIKIGNISTESSPSEEPTTSPNTTNTPSPSPNATKSPSPSPHPSLTPEPGQKPLQYEDMLEHWGAYSAGMLGAEGIIVGEEIGGHFYFYPNKVLNRIEFITLACSVLNIKTKDSLANNPFSDKDIPSYMLRQAIAAYEAGIITGTEENGQLYLNPYDTLTRAQAIQILNNGLNIKESASGPLSFADADAIPLWATQAIRNMEAYGIVKGYEDNTFRPYASVVKAQAGELLYQVYKYREKMRKTQGVFKMFFYDE